MSADTAYSPSLSSPAAYIQTAVAEGPAWPIFGQVGSGCLLMLEYFSQRTAYRGYVVVQIDNRTNKPANAVANYSGAMTEIRRAFGRTFSRLPAVFGVSRQTLYNWLDGEMPKDRHQARIVQLAEAAQAFSDAFYTPDAMSLTRTLSRGKSFLELMLDGADGRDAAQKLMALSQRSRASRVRIGTALADIRPGASTRPSFGAPALDEEPS
jgi:hypothetical protein